MSKCQQCDKIPCFFNSLPDSDNEKFNNKIELKFKKGQIICKQGSFASNVVFLKEGLVKLYTEGDHKNTIICIYRQPVYIGLVSVFGSEFYQFSVSAIEDTTVCIIDINNIKQLILSDNKIALEIITYISKTANYLLENKVNMERKQIRGRLAFILLFLYKQVFQSTIFILPITRKEIAEFAGMSTENVITLLGEFKKDKMIKNEGKHFELLNIGALEELSNKG